MNNVLAFIIMFTCTVFTAYTFYQMGVRHGRELQRFDDYLAARDQKRQ